MSARDRLLNQVLQMITSMPGTPPRISLRAGNAIDSYESHDVPYDPNIDKVTDTYLERYAFFGLPHLDTASWACYLPWLLEYALRSLGSKSGNALVVDGLLWSLRLPQRVPPRFQSLTNEQQALVRGVVELLALSEESIHQDLAAHTLDELG